MFSANQPDVQTIKYHIVKKDLAEKCDIIVQEESDENKMEEDPSQLTMFEIVLLPTWFQTAVAA